MPLWTVHLKGAPKGQDQPAAVAVRHEIYTFGGSIFAAYHSYQIPVNVFNTVTLHWTALPPVSDRKGKRPRCVPSWRAGHTAVLIEDTVYVCGGFTAGGNICKSKPYAFDVDTHRWSQPRVSGTIPKARSYGAACALGRVMYLHGGYTLDGYFAPGVRSEVYFDIYDDSVYAYASDLHKLDTRTMVWSVIVPAGGQPPPPSAYHSTNIIGTKMFVFGGEGAVDEDEDESFHNHVRVFDTETLRWLNHSSTRLRPQAQRLYHSAFTWNRELYVFGSKRRKNPRHLWKFNTETFSWKKVHCKGKGPSDNWMCCCMVGDRLVLFGGYQGFDPVHDDLYVLDLSPSLKMLCKLAVIKRGLEESGLPHNIRWELEAMTGKEHTRPTEKMEDTEKKEASEKNEATEKNEAAKKSTLSQWRY